MRPFNRQRWTALVTAGCLSLPAGLALGQTGEPSKPAGRQRQVTARQSDQGQSGAPQVALRMRFQVIELTLSAEQIRQIDGSAEFVDFQKLAAEGMESGQASVKHAFDTTLWVGQEAKLVSGSRVPLLQSRVSQKSGQVSTQVSYENVGCVLELHCFWPDAEDHTRLGVSWGIEISEVFRDSSLSVGEGINALIHREVNQRFRTIVPVGTDTWFSSLSSHQANAEGPASARAYVYRVRFDPQDAR